MSLIVLFGLVVAFVAGNVTAAPAAAIHCVNNTSHDTVRGARSNILDLFQKDLPIRGEVANTTTTMMTTTKIDGSAGTYLDGPAWAAIIAGAVACLILCSCICWCGRRRNW